MRGLLHVRIPLITRRLITLIPALVILTIGFDPTLALVLSQVVLSFGIPFALVPLVRLTSLKTLLGESANRWWTTLLASVAAVLLIALNATLLVLVLTGS
jgi:manganese transport protein